MSEGFDQFTRWLCEKCGQPGIDSWNKGVFDGTDFGADAIPNPWLLGSDCEACGHPVVLSYTTPDAPVRAIYGPVRDGPDQYSYETAAFAAFEADAGAGTELRPSSKRDVDWSAGCLAAKGQLQ